MKKCLTCQRTYTDESLNFCLDDGTTLQNMYADEPPATVFMPPSRDTNPQAGQQFSGTTGFGSPYGTPSQFGSTPNYQATPAKKGNWLLWVLGGGAILVVLGIVGIVGLIALVAMNTDDNDNKNKNISVNISKNANIKSNTNLSLGNTNTNTSTTSGSVKLKDSFSAWWTGTADFGTATYTGGEYQLRGNLDRYFVIFRGKGNDVSSDYYTKNVTAKVSVRVASGSAPKYGQGLVVHSDPAEPLKRDYAFLIYTDSKYPQYKIVQHQNSDEKTLVKWTSSSAIKTGSATNELEVRIEGKTLSFYINGEYVNKITDTAGYEDGIVGLYTSDNSTVAFSNLELQDN